MALNISQSSDGGNFTALSATTVGFVLLGGMYAFGASATFGGGSVALQMLFPDGSTWVNVIPAFTAEGVALVGCCWGTYRIAITTATAVQGFVARVPYRAA